MLARKLGVQHDAERDIQLFEQAPDPRDAPVDGVLAKRLVHEIGAAARKIRTQDGALAEAELFDEQGEADGDLSAAGPGSNLDRGARESRHPAAPLLPQHPSAAITTEH